MNKQLGYFMATVTASIFFSESFRALEVNIVSFSYCVNNISVKRFRTYPTFPVIKIPSGKCFLRACACACACCSLSWVGPKH